MSHMHFIYDQKLRETARPKPADCTYCAPDHKFYGPGWVYMGNNGPIASCPICNDDGKHSRKS